MVYLSNITINQQLCVGLTKKLFEMRNFSYAKTVSVNAEE